MQEHTSFQRHSFDDHQSPNASHAFPTQPVDSNSSAAANSEQTMTTGPMHARQESATSVKSDEFGSFVSVPVSGSDDPLGAGAGLGLPSPTGASADGAGVSAFDAFADDAKERARENERRVLGDLRVHEKDPARWLAEREDGKESKSTGRDADENGEDFKATDDAFRIGDMLELNRKETLLRPDMQDAGQVPAKVGHALVDVSESSSLPLPSSMTSLPDRPRHSPLPLIESPSPTSSTPSVTIRGREARETQIPNEGPKERAERNEKRVLGELRAHDADPLEWLRSKTDSDDTLESALHEAGSTLIDLDSPPADLPATPTCTPDRISSPPPSGSAPPRPLVFPRASSSPLLARTSDRARSQSPTPRVPNSPSPNAGSAFGLSRSWMSTLGLFGASRADPAASSSSAAQGMHDASTDTGSAGLSPTQSSLHALFARGASPRSTPRRHSRYATDGHPPIHSATMPLPTAPAAASDISPFASHVYIPPSGAPGFAGDHNWNPDNFEFEPGMKAEGRSVRLVGRREPTIPVLNAALATKLRSHLPPLHRLSHSWTLLYSADQHGLSLNTLYARCTPPVIVGGGGIVPGTSTGALLAIQDVEGGIFGAWVPEGIHLSHGSYYGGGDSFLWSVEKNRREGGEECELDLRVYKWTGRNGYVAFCNTDGFSFGGGEGHYGLYMDASLVEGTTHPCPTFDNECLAHGERKGRMVAFDAVGLEVWAIAS